MYPSAKDQQYTIDASCDVFCWGLTYPDLLKCMEASDALVHAIKNEVGDCQTTLSRRIREKAAETEQSIELRQLVPLTILGVGSFGQVKLVRSVPPAQHPPKLAPPRLRASAPSHGVWAIAGMRLRPRPTR